jgi:hypothetical protein
MFKSSILACAISILSTTALADVTVKPGDNLAGIAQIAYGNRDFSQLLARYNKLSGSKVRVGELIKTPSIEVLATHLAPKHQATIAKLASVYAGVVELEKSAKERSGQVLGQALETQLTPLKSDLLGLIDKPATDKRAYVNQLKSANSELEALGKLVIDGSTLFSKTVLTVEKHLILALESLTLTP